MLPSDQSSLSAQSIRCLLLCSGGREHCSSKGSGSGDCTCDVPAPGPTQPLQTGGVLFGEDYPESPKTYCSDMLSHSGSEALPEHHNVRCALIALSYLQLAVWPHPFHYVELVLLHKRESSKLKDE